MKQIVFFLLAICLFNCRDQSPQVSPDNREKAMPTDTPLVFMDHLIPSGQLIHRGIFSPDLGQYYFTLSDPEFNQFDVYVIDRQGDRWSEPQPAFFNSGFSDHGMSFSPDGNALYFSSTRPTHHPGIPSTWHIWKSEKTKGKWSEPAFVDIPNLRQRLVSHPTIDRSGTLYFHASNLDYSEMDIYQAAPADGQFQAALRTPFPGELRAVPKCTPYVAPGGDCLVFATIGEQLDLVIAYRDDSGTWTRPHKLSDAINSHGQGNPYVTPDGRFLFFATGEDGGTDWQMKWTPMVLEGAAQ